MTSRFFARKTRVKGYSFVELMVVMLVMAILFSVGMANYREFQRRQAVESAVRQVRADISLAREYALAARKNCTGVLHPNDELNGYDVTIDAATDTYTIREVCLHDPNDPISLEYFGVKTGVKFPQIIQITTTVSPIRFYVLGRGTDLVGDATITISDSLGNSNTIIVTPAGEIR